ncbi:MAG: hypothetical protein HRT68_02365 [Flavobacteriaceae bacterium]|nr:hypothetical protein [Flavobacteriaceae bacterium]
MFDNISFLSLPLILLQIYCFYHAYKNGKEFFWYFLILFIPLIGCIVYLVTQVFRRRDVESAQETVNKILNPTKKIRELEKAVQFTKTHDNQVALADAYMEVENLDKAILNYENSLDGLFKKDTYVLKQLVIAYYKKDQYDQAIEKAEIIKEHPDFLKSNGLYFYAMALAKNNQTEKAKEVFKLIDKPFSNYKERLDYARFLIHLNEKDEAKTILEELYTESLRASKPIKQKFKSIFNLVKKELNNLQL